MTTDGTHTRRDAIKYLGSAAALTALAGCNSGGGGGDSSSTGQSSTGNGATPEDVSTFRLISGPQNGVTFQMHNAAAGVLERESDLGLDVVAGTSGESMSRLVGGGSQLAFGTAKAGLNASNREGPFANVDFEYDLYQVSTQTTLIEPLVVPASTDHEHWSDLDGVSIATGAQGSTFQAYYREALDTAVGEGNYELVHQGFTEIPQEFSAGRVGAAGGPGIVSGLTPSFMQQLYSDNEVRLLSLSEETKQAVRDHPWLALQTLPNDAFGDSIEAYTQADKTTTIRVDYPHFSTNAVSADSVNGLLNALWDNLDALVDAHPAWKLFQDDQVWVSTLHPDVPVHPGAVAFFKDKGLWDENLTAGSF